MKLAALAAATACILFATGAEAAKFRFGGSKRVATPSTAPAAAPAPRSGFGVGVGTGVIISPRGSRAAEAGREAGSPPDSRVPFPPASAPEPKLRQASAGESAAPWCTGRQVGGFCVLN